MSKVTGEYVDCLKPNNKAYFSLSCDKAMAPGHWKAPIKWTGTIDGKKVEFTQINESGWSKSDYDFSTLPKGLESVTGFIVEAIDDAMRTMD